ASNIAAAVADAGMRAWLEHEEPLGTDDKRERTRRLLLAISGMALALGVLSGWMLFAPPAVITVLFAISLGAAIPLTIRKAWHAVRVKPLDINVLMLIAAAGAIARGQWSEAAAVVFLFAVAQTLEIRTLERARTAVRAVMDLTPTEALVRDAAGERRISV